MRPLRGLGVARIGPRRGGAPPRDIKSACGPTFTAHSSRRGLCIPSIGPELGPTRKDFILHQARVKLRERAAFDLGRRSQFLEVRLTDAEISSLTSRAGVKKGGDIAGSRRRFLRFAQRRQELDIEREAFLSVVEQPEDASQFANHLLTAIGIIGTASWAISGTQVAGEAGLNIVGCALVGCVSSLGGGTVNALLFGRPVVWVRDPTNLVVAITASLATFIVWPILSSHFAERQAREIRAAAALSKPWWKLDVRQIAGLEVDEDEARIAAEPISRATFLAALRDEDLFLRVRNVLSLQLLKKGRPE